MPAFWVIETADPEKIFLAIRYTHESAERCRDEYANRWPQGMHLILTTDSLYGVRSRRSMD